MARSSDRRFTWLWLGYVTFFTLCVPWRLGFLNLVAAGRNVMSMESKPEGGVTVFVLGLLGFVCAPFGIAAWVMGNSYMARCRAMSVEPEGLAVAGRILGIIATCIMILVAVIWGVIICAGGGAILSQ